ncbi:MAG: LysR family hydrogen peroxide-inducible transcriptional activator [Lysobacterales bacterium]|jgi:LysR family hydrogen peroxide-inducible transcriptional activator
MAQLPTLKQLKYLCAVADFKHFSKAAEACFVSQSTLSSGIQELEQILGVCLLERDNKRVELTAVGRDITERARHILTDAVDMVSAASAAHEPFATEIHLGVIPTVAPFVLPGILKHLRKRYPNFKLYIREDLSGHLVKQLQSGELDLLLLALPYPVKNVTEAHLFYDEFLLAYEKHDDISKLKKVRTKDIRNKNLLLLEDGHCLRDHAMDACKIKTQGIHTQYHATSLNTIIQMISNDIGITILPKMAVDAHILKGTDVVARSFDEEGVRRSIGLLWRNKSPRYQEFQLLGNLICESLGQ